MTEKLIGRRFLLAGVATAIAAPAAAGLIPDSVGSLRRRFFSPPLNGLIPADLPRYPAFPATTIPIRSLSDISYKNGASGATVSQIASTDFVDGRDVIKVTVGATAQTLRFALPAPIDMRGGTLTAFLKRASGSGGASMRVMSSGTAASPAAASSGVFGGGGTYIDEVTSNGAFTRIGASLAQASVTSGGADLSAVTIVEINLSSSSGTSEFQLSDLRYTPNPRTKAAVIVRIDDAWIDAYSVLKQRFDAVGAPLFLAPGAVASTNGFNEPGKTPNNPDRMSVAQANEMRALGTQVGTQAWTTEDNQADYPAYLAQFLGMMQYMRDRGWAADAADGTYYTNVNVNTIGARAAMLAAGSRTIQRFKNGLGTTPPVTKSETFPFRDETCIHSLNLAQVGQVSGSTTITSQLMSALDATVAVKGVLIVSGHQDLARQSDELAAIDALISRYTNSADFEFHTMKSLLAPYLTAYGPAPMYPAAFSQRG